MQRGIAWSSVRLACALLALMTVNARLDASKPASQFSILLTTAPDLATETRRTLMAEASRIWAQGGIRLTWDAPDQVAVPGRMLRMVAIARPVAPEGRSRVGQLVRIDKSRAVALVFVEEAQRIADRAGSNPRYLPHQLGVILGRAAAHEIGHYLLDMPTHAATGLMREHFDDGEFSEPHSRAFDLDADANARIARRLEAGLPLGPGVTPSSTPVPPLSPEAAVAVSTRQLHSALTSD